MQTVLIADHSTIFANALATALRDRFAVTVSTDGRQVLDLLQTLQPDILILNLMIPYVDGLTLLQRAAFRPPLILAITTHMSAYVEQNLWILGIDYAMILPSVQTVVHRLEDLLQHYAAPPPQSDPAAKAAHHLQRLNLPQHLDGFRQLCIAIPLYMENPQQFMTKELYPRVARLCGCKDGRSVEHSIRKSIQAAWLQRDNAVWRKYFCPGPQGTLPCPSNKEFISTLAEILRRS